MPKPGVLPVSVSQFDNQTSQTKQDLLVVEEPLEVRINYGKTASRTQKSLAITMRTPGHDFELAIGFLFNEGLITDPEQIKDIRYCTEIKDPAEAENVIIIYLKPGFQPDLTNVERNFYTHSSCGVCGKTSIDHLANSGCQVIKDSNSIIPANVLQTLPEHLRGEQVIFNHTGGIHGVGLFSTDGELLRSREDVGRHNALDKLVGSQFLEKRLPLTDTMCLVSGRAGFELVQKCIMAGIPIMAAVGAPTSLACQLALTYNLTLIGFLKNSSFNVYSGAHRIAG